MRILLLVYLIVAGMAGAGCAGTTASTTPSPAPAAEAAAYPEDAFERAELGAAVRFLASDELMGRKTGTPGNDVAARFIAEQFRAAGLETVPGAEGFFQPVPFSETKPPSMGRLVLAGDTLLQGEGLIVLHGAAADVAAPAVFAGFGLSDEDYAGLDVAGKIVVARAGREADQGVQAAFRAGPEKRAAAEARGAAALVELYPGGFPWRNLVSILGTPRAGLAEADDAPESALPHAWIDDADGVFAGRADAMQGPAAFVTEGVAERRFTSNNVVGMVQGRDPVLREEYVVLMAHYDHVGAGMRNGPGATPADSIFNGARDNAFGVVALMAAAEALAAAPPARSVLFLALTAEEGGLLGSRYYVENPLIPLPQHVFALNVDGAGYSDTGVVTVIGLGRTTADAAIRAGAGAYGLEAIPDPAPEQNLFDRSDNVNFARKGIPAPTFAPGFHAFSDEGVSNYYHRPEDEVDAAFDFDYLVRFAQAYTRAAREVANGPRPAWLPGDSYEEAARALYGE